MTVGDQKYRAKDDLAYPTDAKVLAQLKRGQKPDGDVKLKHVKPGQIVDDVPQQSVKWLLDEGVIEKVGGD